MLLKVLRWPSMPRCHLIVSKFTAKCHHIQYVFGALCLPRHNVTADLTACLVCVICISGGVFWLHFTAVPFRYWGLAME